ncbi:uncharacterized protein LOC121371036 [Gigantopelta aegis]|uniref:uncharacterized protein LOC121371036 n=1 Tax=Gigantopelta aegis TaxID=1735272 RepID=UPI001B88A815|nr:uncharacterized protein LOC121371036 [Gigantopelta aegis]XP_041352587.1 uncharacterized protein LOC121371036 [Gigantopelta aegis]
MNTIHWTLLIQAVWYSCCLTENITQTSVDGQWSSWEKRSSGHCSVTCGSGSNDVTYTRSCRKRENKSQQCAGESRKTVTVRCNTGVYCSAKLSSEKLDESSVPETVTGITVAALGLFSLLIVVLVIRTKGQTEEGFQILSNKKRLIKEMLTGYNNPVFKSDDPLNRSPIVTTKPTVKFNLHKTPVKY